MARSSSSGAGAAAVPELHLAVPPPAHTAVRGGSPTPASAAPLLAGAFSVLTAPAAASPVEEEERLGDALEERHTSSASATAAQRSARPAIPVSFLAASGAAGGDSGDAKVPSNVHGPVAPAL